MAQPLIVNYHIGGLTHYVLTRLQEQLGNNGIQTGMNADLLIHCPADKVELMQQICLREARERAVPDSSIGLSSIY